MRCDDWWMISELLRGFRRRAQFWQRCEDEVALEWVVRVERKLGVGGFGVGGR